MDRRVVPPAWLALCAALLVSFALAAPARADGPSSATGRVHVLMVIDTFGYNAPGLGFAHDGELLLNTLKTQLHRELGPGRSTAEVLTGKEATAARVFKYYRELHSTPEDTLVFVAISHGVIDPVQGHYLEMSSGRLNRLQVRQAMEARSPRLLVLWTGSCASPAWRFDRPQSRLNPPYPAPNRLKADSLQPLAAALQTKNPAVAQHLLKNLLLEHQGVVDLNASLAGMPAYASFGHHQYFIKGLVTLLQHPTTDLDANGDGFVSWQEFLPALQRQTAQLAAADGIWQVPDSFLAETSPAQAFPDWLETKQAIPLALTGRTALFLGSQGNKSLPLLQKALQGKQPQARRLALLSLTYMNSWDKRKALPLVQDALHDSDLLTRSLALNVLRELGPSKAALPALEPFLQTTDKELLRNTLYVLEAIGPPARTTLPLLEKAYAAEDEPLTRSALVYAFSRIAPWKMETLRVVQAGLRDKAPVVRRNAIYALQNVPLLAIRDETIDQLLAAATRDEDVDVRIAALQMLNNLGYVSIYEQALKHENPRLRLTALQGFPTTGPKAEAILPEVVQALNDEAPAVRLKALSVLWKFGPTAKSAVPALEKTMRGESLEEAVKAALVLRSLAPKNAEVLPALIKGLQDPRLDDWETVARTVGYYGPRGRPALPCLLILLEHRDPFVRSRAIDALDLIGVDGPLVAPVLAKMLRDPDAGVRQQALQALGGVFLTDTRSLLPELRAALKDSNPRVQSQAARIFVYWQDSSPAVVAVLLRELQDYSWVSRRDAVDALARLAPQTKSVIPYIVKGLQDKAPEVRRNSAEIVGRLGKEAAKAEENLRGLLQDSDPSVRVAAALALWQITGVSEPCLTNLVQLTRHTKPAVREQAVVALGRMGPAARSQETALKGLLKDSDLYVRWAAADSLQQIDRRFTRPSRIVRITGAPAYVRTAANRW